ncbi:MAG: hypothetical protein Q4B78_04975, partial [Bacillota bacterium]|nr:hypothetical protein [Bacillota bacterium]
ARLFIEAKEIVCLLDPQISDEAEIHAGLWTSACDAVEGTVLRADGKIEIDLINGGTSATHTVSGKFTLATEVRL